MKLIVETTGPFQVFDGPEAHARHDRPSVVKNVYLIQRAIGAGQLRILGQVNDDATDQALVDALKGAKGDVELAVQAFISEFPVEKPAPAPAPKPTEEPKGRKPRAAKSED